MKVKRLELKGFRGFDEIVLDFDTNPQRPTVFIGNNGVGKSSILDSLAILLSCFTEKFEFLVPDNKMQLIFPEYKEWLSQKINWEQIERKVNRFSLNSINNKFDYIFGRITVDENSKESKWDILNNKNDLLYGYKSNKKNDLLSELTHEIYNKIATNADESLPIIVYYSVNRSIHQIPLEIQDIHLHRLIDTYRDALNGENIDFQKFFQWFRNVEDLENENRRDEPDYRNKKLAAVRMAIHELIPEFDNLRVRRNPLRMTVNKNTQELIIDQLSDGEKCLLAMVGDIARRLAIANPSLDDPLQGEGIVLIDEIELHLHPQWQHKIIPRLTETFPNCQFIVTTHSPQVLSHVQPENIYILQSTPNGIIASHPESSYGRDSNQILEDYMGTPERPQDIKDKILEIFQVIDQNDLGQAKKLCESLGSEIGSDEPELIRARAVIKRKEILGK